MTRGPVRNGRQPCQCSVAGRRVCDRTGNQCPFIPGRLPDDAMAMVVAVEQPEGTLLPELVQWLPSAALDEPIGTVGAAALRETAAIVTALIS
jgi:hypothetical protein